VVVAAVRLPILDVTMQNAWLIYRLMETMNHQPMGQLEFRHSVCNVYYKKYTLERTAIWRPMGRPKPLNQRAPVEVRMEGNHYIEAISTQRRCAVCGEETVLKMQCRLAHGMFQNFLRGALALEAL
jgi:hypothetical protein